MTAESVLEVLPDWQENPEVMMMRHFLNDEATADQLDYEDWVQPMKLTGGRVCLLADPPNDRATWFFKWTPDGLEAHTDHMAGLQGRHAVEVLRDWVTYGAEDIAPVLREDTPFAEGDNE